MTIWLFVAIVFAELQLTFIALHLMRIAIVLEKQTKADSASPAQEPTTPT